MERNSETAQTRPGRVILALGRPALHVVLAAFFATLFTWPIVAFDAPLNTWTFMYAGWGFAALTLFVLSRGEDVVDTEAADDADDDIVDSVPAPHPTSTRSPEAHNV